jgi:hypothetical protein
VVFLICDDLSVRGLIGFEVGMKYMRGGHEKCIHRQCEMENLKVIHHDVP